MYYRVTQKGKVVVVTVNDRRLDIDTAENFKNRVLETIEQGHQSIILDLGRVDFMDSTGLGAIVMTKKKLEGNGQVVLANTQRRVLNLLRLSRVDKIFQIFSTKEEALELFANEVLLN